MMNFLIITNPSLIRVLAIDMAEELGLIIPMTEAALERGLIDLKKWHQWRPTLYLSVNLSPQHFAKKGLVDYIASQLESYELPAHLLKIEVTESALLSESTVVTRGYFSVG